MIRVIGPSERHRVAPCRGYRPEAVSDGQPRRYCTLVCMAPWVRAQVAAVARSCCPCLRERPSSRAATARDAEPANAWQEKPAHAWQETPTQPSSHTNVPSHLVLYS